MNPEKKEVRYYEIPESPTREKEVLALLEKTGEYVFHGTNVDLSKLDPRQAVDVERGPDGVPAVFASMCIDQAIFHAIFNRGNLDADADPVHAGSVVTSDGKGGIADIQLQFSATEKTLAQIREESAGWVYVFKKTDFMQRLDAEGNETIEFVSETPVEPVYKIKVLRGDLPRNISIKN